MNDYKTSWYTFDSSPTSSLPPPLCVCVCVCVCGCVCVLLFPPSTVQYSCEIQHVFFLVSTHITRIPLSTQTQTQTHIHTHTHTHTRTHTHTLSVCLPLTLTTK